MLPMDVSGMVDTIVFLPLLPDGVAVNEIVIGPPVNYARDRGERRCGHGRRVQHRPCGQASAPVNKFVGRANMMWKFGSVGSSLRVSGVDTCSGVNPTLSAIDCKNAMSPP